MHAADWRSRALPRRQRHSGGFMSEGGASSHRQRVTIPGVTSRLHQSEKCAGGSCCRPTKGKTGRVTNAATLQAAVQKGSDDTCNRMRVGLPRSRETEISGCDLALSEVLKEKKKKTRTVVDPDWNVARSSRRPTNGVWSQQI